MKSGTLNILGTTYTIEIHKSSEDPELLDNNCGGYCDGYDHLIVLADVDEERYFLNFTKTGKLEFQKRALRHEILHAFLNESGLSYNSLNYSAGWAKNEEMIDWFAIQFPKILKIYQEASCL